MDSPRVALEFDGEMHTRFRIVASDEPDDQGVIVTRYVYERTHPSMTDAMGNPQWQKLDANKGGISDWVQFSKALIRNTMERGD